MRAFGGTLLCLVAAVATCSCARTAIRPRIERPVAGLARPQVILVFDFAFTAADVEENRGLFQGFANESDGRTRIEREMDIGIAVADRLSEDVVAGINDLGLTARRAGRRSTVGTGALALIGEFVTVDEGNQLRRLVIGFGSGQSKVQSQAQLLVPFAGGFRTLLYFDTHADSGTMPGAAVTMGAGAAAQGGVTAGMAAANAAVSGVRTYRSSVDAAAGRTADQVVAYLSEFFYKQGWIAADKVRDAKRFD